MKWGKDFRFKIYDSKAWGYKWITLVNQTHVRLVGQCFLNDIFDELFLCGFSVWMSIFTGFMKYSIPKDSCLKTKNKISILFKL